MILNHNTTFKTNFHPIGAFYTESKINLAADFVNSYFIELNATIYYEKTIPILLFPSVQIYDESFYAFNKNPRTIPKTTIALAVPILNVKIYLEVVKISKMNKVIK